MIDRTISIAPMLEWTDKHYRNFIRLITHHALLYTEMITTQALLRGDKHRHLAFYPNEHPIACQLGGSNPEELAKCANMVEDYGYDEVNLNVGCPSDRVQSGRFGVCLMKTPEVVADCVSAMQANVTIPVTVKTRIGVDDNESYDFLYEFIDLVKKAGCSIFIIHARKAWLNGLSPKENRTIPPLNYPKVYQLKKDFADCEIILNGGVGSLDEAQEHLQKVDGVMLGRLAYHNPYHLSLVDKRFYQDEHKILSRLEVLEQFAPYIDELLSKGAQLSLIVRHILGLMHGEAGGKQFRRYLTESARDKRGIDAIYEWIARMQSEQH